MTLRLKFRTQIRRFAGGDDLRFFSIAGERSRLRRRGEAARRSTFGDGPRRFGDGDFRGILSRSEAAVFAIARRGERERRSGPRALSRLRARFGDGERVDPELLEPELDPDELEPDELPDELPDEVLESKKWHE